MRCERYEQDLTARAAGGTITGDLEAHLEECVACRQRFAEKRALLESVDQVLRADLEVEPSPALRRRVTLAVAQAGERRRIVSRAAAAGLAAGLIILLIAGARARRHSISPPESSAAVISPGLSAREVVTPTPEIPVIPSTPKPLVAANSPAVRSISPPAVAREAFVPEPEVMVPPGQEDAVRRFVAVLRDRSAPPPLLLLTGTSLDGPIVPIPSIEIPMLEAKPLADSVGSAERSPS